MRLSVSALRDYQSCGHYYKLKRIDGLNAYNSHHAAAGTLVHDCFYLAYGTPVELVAKTTYSKPRWEVNPDFDAARALRFFDALWTGDVTKLDFDAFPSDEAIWEILSQTTEAPKNFKPGAKKSLKATSQADLSAGWQEHYREMLQGALERPFDLPVIEIEREITYKLGDHDAVGYIDLVLQDADGEIYVDLKTGYNKPSEQELFFDDQMMSYYTTGPTDIWYFHMRSGSLIAIDENIALQKMLIEVANQTAVAIDSGYFPKRFSKDCVYCPFRTECIGI